MYIYHLWLGVFIIPLSMLYGIDEMGNRLYFRTRCDKQSEREHMANQSVNSERYKNLSVHKLHGTNPSAHKCNERFVTNLTPFL
jgi:hypothetical protein